MVNDKTANKENMGKKSQAMVEFALAIPIVMVLVLAIFEFGRLLFIYTSISAASREGARYGSGIGNSGAEPLYNDCAGIRAATIRIGRFAGIKDSYISIFHIYPNDEYDPSAYPPPDPPVSKFIKDEYCDGISQDNITFGPEDRIEVKVDAPYVPVVPLVNISSFTLHSQNAHSILMGAEVVSTPQPVINTGGPTCDNTPYLISIPTADPYYPTGPTVKVDIENTSATDTSIQHIDIIWENQGNPALVSITDPSGVTATVNGTSPIYSANINWSFPASSESTPQVKTFYLNFSKQLGSDAIVSLTLAGDEGCFFWK